MPSLSAKFSSMAKENLKKGKQAPRKKGQKAVLKATKKTVAKKKTVATKKTTSAKVAGQAKGNEEILCN